jgi:hypothetical protein
MATKLMEGTTDSPDLIDIDDIGSFSRVSVGENGPKREVWGRKNIMELPLKNLIILAQVRTGKNVVEDDLKESIKLEDIENQPNVALMSPDMFEEYISFVNEVHGSDYIAEDHSQLILNGYYSVVIAGNTRVKCMKEIAEEDSSMPQTADCKVLVNPTPQQILRIQIKENIYARPTLEDKAMSLAQGYAYGLRHGLWRNKAEYLKRPDVSLTRDTLDIVLGYAALPTTFREFVNEHLLSFYSASAVGSALPTIHEYHLFVSFDGRKEEYLMPEEYDELLKADESVMQSMIYHIQNQKLNGPAAKKYVSGYVKQLKDTIDNQNISFELAELTGAEALRAKRKAREEQLEEALFLSGRNGALGLFKSLDIHSKLLKDNGEIKTKKARLAKETLAAVGSQLVELTGLKLDLE